MALILMIFASTFAFAQEELTIEGIIGMNKKMNRELSGAYVGVEKSAEQCEPQKSNPSDERASQVYEYSPAEKVELTVLTQEEAQKLFEEIVRPETKDMKLRNFEVCQQRAMMIGHGLHLKGIRSGKFFVTPRIMGVGVNSEAAKPYLNGMNLHVSNVILVENSEGKGEPWVIDPFLFPKGPVPKSEFDKVFTPSLRQPIHLTSEFTYNENHLLLNRTQYNQQEIAEARSDLEKGYSSNSPYYKVMSVERRLQYLQEREAEMKASP